MAGYRPKSLEELNNIFDKTMAAEKAIKKGTSLLEKGDVVFSPAVSTQDTAEQVNEEKPSQEITDSVSDFIARFSAQTEHEPVKAKPRMTVIIPESVKKDEDSLWDIPVQETPASPVRETEKTSRDDLFDEYMKIMSDDDDDFPEEKKLSRKEKKRLRKKEKAESKPAEIQEAEEIAEEAEEEAPEEETAADEDISFAQTEESVYTLQEEAEEAFGEAEAQEEIQESGEEVKDDFDFPEDYTPEWMETAEPEEEAVAEEEPVKVEKKSKKTGLRVILALVLVAVVCTGALATVFKSVVAVNTGKIVADKYYVFTAHKDYPEAGLYEGDLVITEKKYAEDGEIFAFVDYNKRTFEFGKRADSITKDDGEVLYVTEKDGSRTLVSRDDCKGVVLYRYEGRGAFIAALTDNYIVIISLAVLISLVIVLVFALALKSKKEEDGELEADGASEETEDVFEDIFSTIE